MSFTYTPGTSIGNVRLLIGDTVSPGTFSNEDIQAILDLNDGDVYSTAAAMLRTLAVSKALLEQYVRAGEYTEDTRGMSKALLELAQTYDDKAASVPAEGTAEFAESEFSAQEFIRKEVARGTA